MTSNALAILLSLNALASTSLAQDPATDPNYRGNDPEGAVTTSKLQIHVSNTRVSKIYSSNIWNFLWNNDSTVIAAVCTHVVQILILNLFICYLVFVSILN